MFWLVESVGQFVSWFLNVCSYHVTPLFKACEPNINMFLFGYFQWHQNQSIYTRFSPFKWHFEGSRFVKSHNPLNRLTLVGISNSKEFFVKTHD
jgi:hypothetical protein